jgi:hypothetical protein
MIHNVKVLKNSFSDPLKADQIIGLFMFMYQVTRGIVTHMY